MTLHFTTLGCKVNQYETSALQTLLIERGHRLANEGEHADVVVINTCAVTSESVRKSRQAIRKAKAAHPGAIVAVCGCFSELSPEEVADLEADLIHGSTDRIAFVETLETIYGGDTPTEQASKAMDQQEFELLPAGSLDSRTRALLKVQDGCENFCTYCIIPYARGPVRSISLDKAVEQAKTLEAEGYKELVITGIEISSYGRDRKGEGDLLDLIEAICKAVPELRIRLGSLEPRTITEDFCTRLSSYPNLCPHFHLSLQSGCDDTLRRMGRHYDTARYLESVTHLQESFPDCAITTDLIVGFPGESHTDFEKSLEFMRKCAFSAVHIFPYSERKGTKAVEMEDQVPKAQRTKRAKQAREIAEKLRQDFLSSQVGKTVSVLFESEENGICRGHTPNYCTVLVEGSGLQNSVRDVRTYDVSGETLLGNTL